MWRRERPQSNLDAFMNAHAERELQFGIDRLVTSGERIFGWGWVAHPAHAIAAITLLSQGDGWERRLPVSLGLARGDVDKAFPGLRNAGSAGFVVTGYLPGYPVRKLALEILFDGDAGVTLDITHVLEMRRIHRRKLQQWLWLTQAVWRRLKRGDIHGLLHRAKAQNYFAPALDDRDIAGQLLRFWRGACRGHRLRPQHGVARISIGGPDRRAARGGRPCCCAPKPADARLPAHPGAAGWRGGNFPGGIVSEC
jgi:hypothetical protein